MRKREREKVELEHDFEKIDETKQTQCIRNKKGGNKKSVKKKRGNQWKHLASLFFLLKKKKNTQLFIQSMQTLDPRMLFFAKQNRGCVKKCQPLWTPSLLGMEIHHLLMS